MREEERGRVQKEEKEMAKKVERRRDEMKREED